MKNYKKKNKEELDKFKSIFLTKVDEMTEKYPDKKFTVWEVVAKVLSEASGYDVYYLTLKADLEVIKLIAEGLSASSIANRLSIPSQYIYDVANIWGMFVLDYSLDFNPMYVYRDDMTAQELSVDINDVLAVPITENIAKNIVNNIDKYYEFINFLEEYDNEKG